MVGLEASWPIALFEAVGKGGGVFKEGKKP